MINLELNEWYIKKGCQEPWQYIESNFADMHFFRQQGRLLYHVLCDEDLKTLSKYEKPKFKAGDRVKWDDWTAIILEPWRKEYPNTWWVDATAPDGRKFKGIAHESKLEKLPAEEKFKAGEKFWHKNIKAVITVTQEVTLDMFEHTRDYASREDNKDKYIKLTEFKPELLKTYLFNLPIGEMRARFTGNINFYSDKSLPVAYEFRLIPSNELVFFQGYQFEKLLVREVEEKTFINVSELTPNKIYNIKHRLTGRLTPNVEYIGHSICHKIYYFSNRDPSMTLRITQASAQNYEITKSINYYLHSI